MLAFQNGKSAGEVESVNAFYGDQFPSSGMFPHTLTISPGFVFLQYISKFIRILFQSLIY